MCLFDPSHKSSLRQLCFYVFDAYFNDKPRQSMQQAIQKTIWFYVCNAYYNENTRQKRKSKVDVGNKYDIAVLRRFMNLLMCWETIVEHHSTWFNSVDDVKFSGRQRLRVKCVVCLCQIDGKMIPISLSNFWSNHYPQPVRNVSKIDPQINEHLSLGSFRFFRDQNN